MNLSTKSFVLNQDFDFLNKVECLPPTQASAASQADWVNTFSTTWSNLSAGTPFAIKSACTWAFNWSFGSGFRFLVGAYEKTFVGRCHFFKWISGILRD